jgi:hypothetical protein
MRPITAFVTAIGLAIVITALTLEGRQTPAVINSIANGASRLTEASLGQMPSARSGRGR